MTAPQVSYKHAPGQYPHIEWIELNAGDGVMHECVIMKRDQLGNVLFFKTNDLDNIDKKRLANRLSVTLLPCRQLLRQESLQQR